MNDLKIYFFGSISGVQPDHRIIRRMIKHLKTKGTVLSEFLFSENYKKNEHLGAVAIHDRDLRWIAESDVMIGDVTSPSLGVGYELRQGVITNKPILCLYKPQNGKFLSAMIEGSGGINVVRYHEAQSAERAIDEFLELRGLLKKE